VAVGSALLGVRVRHPFGQAESHESILFRGPNRGTDEYVIELNCYKIFSAWGVGHRESRRTLLTKMVQNSRERRWDETRSYDVLVRVLGVSLTFFARLGAQHPAAEFESIPDTPGYTTRREPAIAAARASCRFWGQNVPWAPRGSITLPRVACAQSSALLPLRAGWPRATP
jgi:hypothetical protein